MNQKIRKALHSRRQQQGGFTLIELLVVITILGILAAVVVVSLLGITSTARKNALAAEKQTVQTAFDAMLHDQHVDPTTLATYCNPTKFTSDMTNFPIGGATYSPPNSSLPGVVTVLSTHYLRQTSTTDATYACDAEGNVLQGAAPAPSPAGS